MALKGVCPHEGALNRKVKKYRHITYEDRVQMEGWVKAGLSPAEMAALIGCHVRTVKRELANAWEEKQTDWTTKTRYTYDFAQMRHEERGAKKGRRSKLKDRAELAKFLETKIEKDQYSPEAAWFAARNEGLAVDVSVKTLYNSIDRGELGAVKRRDLLRRDGRKKEKPKPRKGSHTKGLQAAIPGVTCYYAHPYSSFERGSNENANGMIRRFFPKGTDFSRVSKRKIQQTQEWINTYPRKILNGLSSKDFLLRLDN
jgi:IS30 family transposase